MSENGVFRIRFTGGTKDPASKFLLWLVGEQEEISYYAALSSGLVILSGDDIVTNFQLVKVFMTLPMYHALNPISQSFYIELSQDPEANVITIKHPSGGYWFEGSGRIMRKSEIQILLQDNESLKFYLRQKTLPLEQLKKIISIKRPALYLPKGRRVGIIKRKEKIA